MKNAVWGSWTTMRDKTRKIRVLLCLPATSHAYVASGLVGRQCILHYNQHRRRSIDVDRGNTNACSSMSPTEMAFNENHVGSLSRIEYDPIWKQVITAGFFHPYADYYDACCHLSAKSGLCIRNLFFSSLQLFLKWKLSWRWGLTVSAVMTNTFQCN